MCMHVLLCIFFIEQKSAYEMRISDWSSDVCSSDLVAPTRPLQTQAGSQISTSTPAQNGAVDPKVVVNGMQGERAASSPGPDPRDPAAIAQATIEQPINDVATEVSGNPMPMVPDHERPLGRSDGLIEHVPVGDPTGKVEPSVVVGRATAKAEKI